MMYSGLLLAKTEPWFVVLLLKETSGSFQATRTSPEGSSSASS